MKVFNKRFIFFEYNYLALVTVLFASSATRGVVSTTDFILLTRSLSKDVVSVTFGIMKLIGLTKIYPQEDRWVKIIVNL